MHVSSGSLTHACIAYLLGARVLQVVMKFFRNNQPASDTNIAFYKQSLMREARYENQKSSREGRWGGGGGW